MTVFFFKSICSVLRGQVHGIRQNHFVVCFNIKLHERERERAEDQGQQGGGGDIFHFDMGGHFAPVLLSPPSPPSPSPVLKVTGILWSCDNKDADWLW